MIGNRRHHVELRADRGRNLDFAEAGQGRVDGRVVAVDDRAAALLAIHSLNLGLDFVDGLFRRNHVGQLEEAGLHHGIDADAQVGLLGHLVGVDDVELQLLFNNLLLHFAGQVVPHLVGAVRTVEKERRSRQGHREHVDPLGELELVAGHEVRLVDQV